jgi:hypothetical protein
MSWHKIGMFKAVVHYFSDDHNSFEIFDYEIFSFEHRTDGSLEDIIREEINSHSKELIKIIDKFVDNTVNPQEPQKAQSLGDIFKAISVPNEPTVEIKSDQTEFFVDVYGELWGFSVVYPSTPNGPEEYDYHVDFRDVHCKMLEKEVAEKYICQEDLPPLVDEMDYSYDCDSSWEDER